MNCKHDKVPDNATLHPTTHASKDLSSVEQHYSNIEWETSKEVCIITDYKPLEAIISKDVATLSQHYSTSCSAFSHIG